MAEFRLVGKSVPRIDGPDKATGKARYAVDVTLPGTLTGKILRSPLAHARILNVDASRAMKVKGVRAVISASDAPRAAPEKSPFDPERRIFAINKVRFMGEEVAAVAAVDEDTAGEALEAIQVEYEPVPAVMSAREALAPGAPLLRDGPDNVAARFSFIRGDPEAGFAQATHIFEDEVDTQIQYQCYLEPMSCLCECDASGKLTFWLASMDPSGIRLSLAATLGLPESKVRVIQAHVGGAFGGKITMQPIHPISGLLAKKTGLPVKITFTREEEFLATTPRLPAHIYIRSGFSKDGTLLAKECQLLAENGAYTDRGPRIAAKGIVVADNLYRIPNIKSEATVVYTNKNPVGAFRGFGTTQAIFALETHLDRVARELNMAPADLRLRNATQPGDVTAHGWKIGTCELGRCIREASQAIGWNEKKKGQGPFRGLGLACSPYDCDARNFPGFGGSVVFVKLKEDGTAQVITGEADYGQGSRTIFAQMAAEILGLSMEEMEVTHPDTDLTPFSHGPWALRVTVSGGNAVRLAAEDARDQILKLAAEMLEANPQDLEMGKSCVQVKGSPEKNVSLAKLGRYAIFRPGGSAILGKGIDEPDTVARNPQSMYGHASRAYIFASQAMEVQVDRETGQAKILELASAHDLGTAVNPFAAEGQVEGGIATGLGYACLEEVIYQEGTIINPNLVDYRLPTALDMPRMKTILVEPYEPACAFGAKAVGMPGTIMPPPALANAIWDAAGVRIRELPITPDKILKALEQRSAKDR